MSAVLFIIRSSFHSCRPHRYTLLFRFLTPVGAVPFPLNSTPTSSRCFMSLRVWRVSTTRRPSLSPVPPLFAPRHASLTHPRNYLIRHEIIAMHEVGVPQIYPVCFQANLLSSGSVIPSETVTFPSAYNQNDDFRRFNLYWGDDFNAFKNPGPAVWNGQGGGAVPAPAPTSRVAAGAGSSAAAAPTGNGGGEYGNEGGATAPTAPQESASKSLVTSNAMATGKRPGKHCRRR